MHIIRLLNWLIEEQIDHAMKGNSSKTMKSLWLMVSFILFLFSLTTILVWSATENNWLLFNLSAGILITIELGLMFLKKPISK